LSKKGSNTPGGNSTAIQINQNLRKKTTSVEPPEIMIDFEYKSKSSIGGYTGMNGPLNPH
jgi:hypothetical protein